MNRYKDHDLIFCSGVLVFAIFIILMVILFSLQSFRDQFGYPVHIHTAPSMPDVYCNRIDEQTRTGFDCLIRDEKVREYHLSIYDSWTVK